MTSWRIIESECVAAMAAMPEASIDAVVTAHVYVKGRLTTPAQNDGLELRAVTA